MAAKKTIVDLDIEIKQLLARKAGLLKAQGNAEQKKRDRQNYIVGAWVQANDKATVEKIKFSLVRDQDRLAFDLAVLPKTEAATVHLVQPGQATDIQI